MLARDNESNSKAEYFGELRFAMKLLAEYPGAVFLGQAIVFKGTAMTATFADVPRAKMIEMPVAEDMQMGMATGMALAGMLPITVYPRWNFLLLATNQLVLHLDKLPLYSDYRPKVIIRTAVATVTPLNPGPQHVGDFCRPFREMLKTVKIVRLHVAKEIVPEYTAALKRPESTILVESTGEYA
jgi:pyruvate/2-oxoglutarate/acetoin dehydrogenase E1 component